MTQHCLCHMIGNIILCARWNLIYASVSQPCSGKAKVTEQLTGKIAEYGPRLGEVARFVWHTAGLNSLDQFYKRLLPSVMS